MPGPVSLPCVFAEKGGEAGGGHATRPESGGRPAWWAAWAGGFEGWLSPSSCFLPPPPGWAGWQAPSSACSPPLLGRGPARGWAPERPGGQDRAAGGGQVRAGVHGTPRHPQLQAGLPTFPLGNPARHLGGSHLSSAQASASLAEQLGAGEAGAGEAAGNIWPGAGPGGPARRPPGRLGSPKGRDLPEAGRSPLRLRVGAGCGSEGRGEPVSGKPALGGSAWGGRGHSTAGPIVMEPGPSLPTPPPAAGWDHPQGRERGFCSWGLSWGGVGPPAAAHHRLLRSLVPPGRGAVGGRRPLCRPRQWPPGGSLAEGATALPRGWASLQWVLPDAPQLPHADVGEAGACLCEGRRVAQHPPPPWDLRPCCLPECVFQSHGEEPCEAGLCPEPQPLSPPPCPLLLPLLASVSLMAWDSDPTEPLMTARVCGRPHPASLTPAPAGRKGVARGMAGRSEI